MTTNGDNEKLEDYSKDCPHTNKVDIVRDGKKIGESCNGCGKKM